MKTLKDKFDDVEIVFEGQEGYIKYDEMCDASNKCIIIAEEFAIGFTEWCTKYRELNRNYKGEILYALSKYDDVFLIEELLEIYKKEKGL